MDEIVSFDESRFLVDQPGNYSYDQVGSRRIIAHHTGHDKLSVCCLFAATASGIKLPFIGMVKRKKPFPGLITPSNCILAYSKKGTFKTLIMHDR